MLFGEFFLITRHSATTLVAEDIYFRHRRRKKDGKYLMSQRDTLTQVKGILADIFRYER